MTTSLLHTHGRYLNDHDLQALRDYALEAPFAWRMALEQLIQYAEEGKEADKYEAERDEARARVRETRKTLDVLNGTLDQLIPGENTEGAKNMDVYAPALRLNLQAVYANYAELYESLADDKKPSGAAVSPPSGGAGDPGSRSPA